MKGGLWAEALWLAPALADGPIEFPWSPRLSAQSGPLD